MRPTTTLRQNLHEIDAKVQALLEKKGGEALKKKGLQQEDCAKIVAFAAKLKDPLDGQDPSPIPPVRRFSMLRLVVAEAPFG